MAQKRVLYARLICHGDIHSFARYYEGETVGDLKQMTEYDPNFRMRETTALNLLGERGYEIYGEVEMKKDGAIPTTIFRLRRTVEE